MKNSPTKATQAEIDFIKACQKAYNTYGDSDIDNGDFLAGTSHFATTVLASNCQMLDEEDVGKYLDDVVKMVHEKVKVINKIFEKK